MKHFSSNFRMLSVFVSLLDFLSFNASLLIGYWLWIAFRWHGNFQPFSVYSMILWILPPVGLIVFKAVGLYKPEMGVIGVQEQSLIFKAIWITYLIIFALSFFYRGVSFSRLATFYSIFISLFFISIERFLIRRFFEWLNRKGIAVRHAVIYGAGYHGQRLERWIRQSPQLGIRVIGFLDDAVDRLVKKPVAPPWIGYLADLQKIAAKKNLEMVFVAHPKLEENKVVEIFQLCRDLRLECWAIPSLYQFYVERAQFQNIGGIPLVGFREGFGRRSYVAVKRVLDVGIASVMLILTLPLWLFLSAALWITSGPPIFFHQIRIGKNNKRFVLYKFRTLRSGTRKDEISPELRKEKKMTTPFAAFLRRSGLDELPQLINVLRGDMSLVGPRPEMPFIVDKYGSIERERLTVKPGLTGLWQISEDRKRLLIHENMDYDLYYVENMGFNLDLAICVKTFWTVLKRFLETSKEG